jgi:hypothetical protein
MAYTVVYWNRATPDVLGSDHSGHIAAGTVDALRQKMRAVFANLQCSAEGNRIQDRVV